MNCWLLAAGVPLFPLCISLTSKCLSAKPLPQPRGRPWLDSSVPSLPGNGPSPRSNRKEQHKKRREQQQQQKACNISTRPADFPGRKSSAAWGVQEWWQRAGEMPAHKVVTQPSSLHTSERNHTTSVTVCVMKLRGSNPVLPDVSSPLAFMLPALPATRLGVITSKASVLSY